MDTDADYIEMQVLPPVACPECQVFTTRLLVSIEPVQRDDELIGLATIGRIPACGHEAELPLVPPDLLARVMNTAENMPFHVDDQGLYDDDSTDDFEEE